MNRTSIAVAGISLITLAACSSSGTGPNPSLALTSDDSAQVALVSAADATAEDVGMMYSNEASASLSIVPDRVPTAQFSTSATGDSTRFAFWGPQMACPLSAGRFTCPAVTKNGLTLNRSYAFLDASGNPMSAYDALLTASANFAVSVAGIQTLTNGQDTLARARSMTATGLLGTETTRTWNGTGTRTDGGYRTETARSMTYHNADASTLTNIVVHLPRSTNPFPFSGTVTRSVTGSGSVTKGTTTRTLTVSRTVTITFNGTRLVPMTVGSAQYTLDLYTGKATKN